METARRPNLEDRSIRELLADAGSQTAELIRKEMQLARLEIAESISTLRAAVTSMGIGGILAFAGFLVLLASAVLGLDRWIEAPWLSALLVGAGVTAVGVALLAGGRRTLSSDHLLPERSPQSLRRDKELAQRHI